MDGKHLGKILKADFGLDSDNRFGLRLTFQTTGGNCDTFIGLDNRWKVTVREAQKLAAEYMLKWMELLAKAKKMHIQELEGIPIQVEFRKNTLYDWRILEEVL